MTTRRRRTSRAHLLPHPDNLCLQHELSVAIKDALHVLLPRLHEVIRLYYEDGVTMKEIGLKLGVNESRVSQMPQ